MRVHLPLQQGLRLYNLNLLAPPLGCVRVHLPLQQGLRQRFFVLIIIVFCASASSITTRIKTLSLPPQTSPQWRVRVHLPLQQGLRHVHNTNPYFNLTSASASSITTRIKTSQATYQRTFSNLVRVHLPLQQGLRLLNLL